MPHTCCLCKKNISVFFVWTSTRDFPRRTLFEKLENSSEKEIKYGIPICFHCKEELKEC